MPWAEVHLSRVCDRSFNDYDIINIISEIDRFAKPSPLYILSANMRFSMFCSMDSS